MEAKIRPLNTQQGQVKLINDYYGKGKTARERGQLLAWGSGICAAELLSAMDIYLIFPENYAAGCGALKVSTEHCEVAETLGYPQDLCSYARNQLGSTALGEKAKSRHGPLPRPDLLLCSNNQCSTITKWFQAVSREFNIPLLITDVPYLHGDIDDERFNSVLGYVKEQLKEHIAFLEQFTGRHYDHDRLQECVALTRKSAQLYADGLRMCRHIPSPMTAFDGFINIFGIMCLRGSEESVAFYEQFKAEIAERVAEGFAAIPNERYRLYWDNLPVWFKLRDFTTKFISHGACVVAASYFWNWLDFMEALDPSQPLDSLARGIIQPYINHGLEYKIEWLANCVEEYSIDGLVMQSTRSCKPFFMGQYDIIEAVEKRTGVPGVIIESDMCDLRFHSDAQVDARLDAFFEVLATRRRDRSG